MKPFLYFFLFLPVLIFSQERNEKVRHLNAIIELMDEASRLNYTYYYDAVQLARGVYKSSKEVNPGYFYSSRGQHSGAVYYTGMEKAFRFKELTPDANKRLPGYMADLIPYLEEKEKALLWLKKPHPGFDKAIDSVLLEYITKTDSLFYYNSLLSDYVATKTFTTDAKFTVAKKILKQNETSFINCQKASEALYDVIEKFYLKDLPLNKSHQVVQQAEKELKLTINLFDTWQKELAVGNNSNNSKYDSLMRHLNAVGLSKDSVYLYKTRGYGSQNNGWWAHSRYRSFYSMMQSTIYWYKTERYNHEPYLKPEYQHYNKFTYGYNSSMEYYNRFIELTDGKKMSITSSCCLSPGDLDTNQNIMLNKPRLLHLFAYVDVKEEDETITVKHHSKIENEGDRELIQKAVPHHLIYVLDASSSMTEFGRIDSLKKTTKYLVKLQRSQDHISIVTFASIANVILKNNACNYKSKINAKIDEIEAKGSTNIKDGIFKSSQIVDSCQLKNGITKILLITDGAFKIDKATSKIIKSFKNKKTGFCIIYLGGSSSKKLEEEFKAICKKANGRFYNTNSINLKDILVKEASE